MLSRALLLVAACLTAAAVLLPLWGMTLVSTQYPDGLRMIVYPTHIQGDITELNLLNHYIGMAAISDNFFIELKLLPLFLGVAAAACLAAAFIRARWVRIAPLAVMGATAAYGTWSMYHRLYQFGHDLDPSAPIHIAPFTPPPIGTNQIAQFATYSYFSWGTFLPLAASLLIVATLWLDAHDRRAADAPR
ncbi:MAG TPA: hypothetical protein VFJ96_12500 [Gemmatimonadaceae bacterium]|nr:hypothetical protein [Gemmatimonadaceae bacterium]